MKPRRRLRKWVVYTLRVIFVLSFIVGGSDCEDMKIFVISHLVATATLCLSGYVLIKNMNMEEE